MSHFLRAFPSLTLLLPLCAGCPLDDDHTGDEGGVLQTFTIEGTVTRAEAAVPVGDGVGTLFVAVLEECSLGAPVVGGAVVPGADVADASAVVEYETDPLPPGEYELALFLDDDLDADSMAPLPDPGDLVYAEATGDGVLSCVSVTIDGEDALGVDLLLTAIVPG